MENKSHALAAGLFVLLLGAALVSVALWFSKDDGQKLVPYIITTTADVSGLKPEAPVRYRGVDVGKVHSIRLDPAARGMIAISIGVDPATPVTAQTYAQLGYLGVTGITFISLQDKSTGGELLSTSQDKPARIAMRPSLMDSGENLLASVGALVDQAGALLNEENRGRAARLLANAELAAARLGQLAERLEPAARQLPALVTDARGALGDARGALVAVKTAASDVGSAADSVGTTAQALDKKLDMLNAVAANVEEVGSTARVIQEETLPRLNALADGLNRQTRSLDRVIQTLGDQPQSLVFGSAPPLAGPGEPGYRAGGAQ